MIKRTFHFMGGVHLAIALIALSALAVTVGTFLESKTESHLLAAKWTYEHPFFFILLALFFINILFAALRRWPFKKRHIPFLIVHLGLLMIISGTMIKNLWGLQGEVLLWEGTSSNRVLLPQTHAIAFLDSFTGKQHQIELASFRPNIYSLYEIPSLSCKLIAYAPHVFEAPYSHRLIPETPPAKLEDHRPGIVLELEEEAKRQNMALAYQPTGSGPMQQALDRYAIRFQPLFQELPFQIRLRQARQIFYPGSSQTYSYECDVWIDSDAQTLSMNKVYETKDGYRLYLSGIAKGQGDIKRAQLVVNRDPAKYLLTYPGAFFVFIGIGLLFKQTRKK